MALLALSIASLALLACSRRSAPGARAIDAGARSTGDPTLTTTVSAVDPRAGTCGEVLLTLDQFEVQAVSTTSAAAQT